MKTVFSTRMVAHVWAQQTQSEGRNAHRSLYFRDRTIFSYGEHYPAATFIDPLTVWINSHRCSVTTRRHLSRIERALDTDVQKFHVPHIPVNSEFTARDVRKNLEYLIEVYSIALLSAQRGRENAPWKLREAQRAYEDTRAFADRYAPGAELPAAIPQSLCDKINAAIAAHEAREREEARKRQAQFAPACEAWRAGESVVAPLHALPVMLRMARSGQIIQTSHGAEVPASSAAHLWELVRACRDTQTTWAPGLHGVRIGDFQLSAIDATGTLRAGCHTIEYAELERMARTLGLTGGAA